MNWQAIGAVGEVAGALVVIDRMNAQFGLT